MNDFVAFWRSFIAPKPKAGEWYHFRQTNPFEDSWDVLVIDVKDGYVLYDNYYTPNIKWSQRSMKIDSFHYSYLKGKALEKEAH